MKILVSGAGIAGNASAFFLSRQGHDVTVVERFPDIRASGLQIDLRGHGVTVLTRMGLEPAFRERSVAEQGLQVVDKSGKRIAYFPVNKSGKGVQSFTTEYEIMRGDLAELFHDHVKDRARFIFGTSIESYSEDENGVSVQLANGIEDHFDLLIGADGQNSRTRKLMLGPGAPDAFRQIPGSYAAYFHAPRPAKEGEIYNATMYMARGQRGIMTRRADPHRIQVYLGCTKESKELAAARGGDRTGDVLKQKAVIADIFKGIGWEGDELVAAMHRADDFYLERIGLVKLDKWSRGRVVVVGDAAYCPSANTGMGTTSGLVGSYILAGEIGKHCGLPSKSASTDAHDLQRITAALQAYEKKFRPFITQVQAGVEERSGGFEKLMSSPLGISVQNCLLSLAALFKLNVFDWFLKETVKDWTLPDYEIDLE